MKSFFVTGTDTEVGKTFVGSALLSAFNRQGLTTLGYKPVAAGCELNDGQWQNEDALALMQAASIKAEYHEVNPIALQAAIAPHIAAQLECSPIHTQTILTGYQRLAAYQPDVLLVEGAGGWQLPLGNQQFMPDVVQSLNLPVVLVVGMRLGCLNHALLTAQAIAQCNLPLVAWVANLVDPDMPYLAENIAILEAQIDAPCIAKIPRCQNHTQAQDFFDLSAF